MQLEIPSARNENQMQTLEIRSFIYRVAGAMTVIVLIYDSLDRTLYDRTLTSRFWLAYEDDSCLVCSIIWGFNLLFRDYSVKIWPSVIRSGYHKTSRAKVVVIEYVEFQAVVKTNLQMEDGSLTKPTC